MTVDGSIFFLSVVICSYPVTLVVCSEDMHAKPVVGRCARVSVSTNVLSCRVPEPLRVLLAVPEPSVCALLGPSLCCLFCVLGSNFDQWSQAKACDLYSWACGKEGVIQYQSLCQKASFKV